MIYLNDENFSEKILEGYSIVDFFATWCGPCKMMEPIFEKISSSYSGCNFYKVDVDTAPITSSKFFIMSVPTLLIFKDGEKIAQNIGALDEEGLIEFLDKNVKK